MEDDYPRALGAAEAVISTVEIMVKCYRNNPAIGIERIAEVIAQGRARINQSMPSSAASDKEVRDAIASQQQS